MSTPVISHYMTRQPWTVRPGASLAQASELMRDHGVRHLPVLDGGELVGLLSERDASLYERAARDANATVEDAMTVDVYAVHADAALAEVADAMARHKYGSVVVIDRRGHVEGIFTTVDAMRALADALRAMAA
jgi:acetoin utilization protein AcuB